MAREKKKAELRPDDGAAVGRLTGYKTGEATPPVVPVEPKGRGARKGGVAPPPPTPEVVTRPSAKPRPRKPVAPIVPDRTAFAAGLDEVKDIPVQAREARTQLQRELEERQALDREFESFRQRSQAAHERLLSDAEEAHQLHEKLLSEAKEARAAHQQLLVQTREGAELAKREHAAAVAQLAGVGQEVAKLLEQVKEGTAILKRECVAAAERISEAGREVEALRLQSMQELPRQAEAFRLRLAEAGAEVDAFEQDTAAVRQNRETVERETQQAHHHLDTLRAEVATAERQLAAVRLESVESRRHIESANQKLEPVVAVAPPDVRPHDAAKQDSEPVAEEVPPQTVEVETRNHLGIIVDPGVVVAEVTPGTPAATAGLVRGDVIKSVDGIPVFSGPELRERILDRENLEELTLQLTRGGLEVRFEAGDDKSPEEKHHLGATVEAGVVIAEVAPDSPGAVAGLMRGDVVTAVNGVEVFTGAELRRVIDALESHAEVTLRYTRGGTAHVAAILGTVRNDT